MSPLAPPALHQHFRLALLPPLEVTLGGCAGPFSPRGRWNHQDQLGAYAPGPRRYPWTGDTRDAVFSVITPTSPTCGACAESDERWRDFFSLDPLSPLAPQAGSSGGSPPEYALPDAGCSPIPSTRHRATRRAQKLLAGARREGLSTAVRRSACAVWNHREGASSLTVQSGCCAVGLPWWW